MVNPEPMELSALGVAELLTWLDLDADTSALLTTLIKEKTGTLVEVVVEAASRVIGGSFEHRGEVMLLSRGIHINFNPSVMSFLDINSDTATKFAKKGGEYTIIFQAIKVRAASYLMHRLTAGEEVTGDWAIMLDCDSCTREIFDGQFSSPHPPTYEGVHITNVGRMVFKPSIRPLIHLDPTLANTNQRLYSAPHVYLAEAFVTAALNYRNLACVIEDQVASTADDFTVTHSVSQTDIARCDIHLLMLCIIQRLCTRPDFLSIHCDSHPGQ